MCGGHGGAWCKLVACCGGDGHPNGKDVGLHDVKDVMLRLLELHNHSAYDVVYDYCMCLSVSVDASICLSVLRLMLLGSVMSLPSTFFTNLCMVLLKSSFVTRSGGGSIVHVYWAPCCPCYLCEVWTLWMYIDLFSHSV